MSSLLGVSRTLGVEAQRGSWTIHLKQSSPISPIAEVFVPVDPLSQRHLGIVQMEAENALQAE